jgi:hypothetical protein
VGSWEVMAIALTEAHHQWVKDVTGIDPAAYPTKPDPADGDDAAQQAAADGGVPDELASQKKLFKNMGQTWAAAEAKIHDDIERLRQELVKALDGHPEASQVEADFMSHANKIFDTLDGSLTGLLHSADACRSSEEIDQLKTSVSKVLDSYASFVDSDPVISHLDENPFTDVSISKDCHAALAAMVQSVA